MTDTKDTANSPDPMPGRWVVIESSDRNGTHSVVEVETHTMLAYVQKTPIALRQHGAPDHALANALVMAASKDLLDALKIARRHVFSAADAAHLLDGFGPRSHTAADDQLAVVDAAIARAEGRAS